MLFRSLLPWFLAAIVLCAFAALYLLQAAIRSSPRGALARRLHPWFYAGLFLDERVTQAGFAAWPLHDTRSRT